MHFSLHQCKDLKMIVHNDKVREYSLSIISANSVLLSKFSCKLLSLPLDSVQLNPLALPYEFWRWAIAWFMDLVIRLGGDGSND
jgi:hypothetical protein